ncbi:MAG: CvpA family protein [Verrucomicrobia bacterium]|nr:CvpA family protein [Verrucomicrobiota bacterium]
MMPMLAMSVAWFDLVALGALAAGVVMGLRRGLSEELFPLVQWLAIFLICGATYKVPGDLLASLGKIQPGFAYVACYLALAALMLGGFALLRRVVGLKLVERQAIGAWETPLGGVAGAGRCACILLMILALLNAKYVSPEEQERLRQPRTGSDAPAVFAVESVQNDVFAGSRAGAFAQRSLGGLLITSSPPVGYFEKKIEGFGKKMERAVNEGIEAAEKK